MYIELLFRNVIKAETCMRSLQNQHVMVGESDQIALVVLFGCNNLNLTKEQYSMKTMFDVAWSNILLDPKFCSQYLPIGQFVKI